METSIENVGDYLSKRAEDMGEKLAVKEIVGGDAVGRLNYKGTTFKNLELETNRLSHFLKKKGIERGMKVLVLVRPGLELIRLVFALFKIGAVPVVIDPGMGLNNFLICVQQVQPTGMLAVPTGYWLSKLFYKAFGSVKISIKVAPGYFENEQHTEPLLEKVKRDDLAAILFTSGSTGKPKGVEYEHAMFMAQLAMIRDEYKIEPGEIDFPMLPVFALFNPGLGVTTIVPQMNPSRPAKADSAKLVQAIIGERVTNSFGSPAIWHSIVNYCEKKEIDFPGLKRVLLAGAPVEPLLIERLKKLMPIGQIFTPYGATEALPVTSISGTEILKGAAKRSARGEGICVGRALRGTEVKIVAIGERTARAAGPRTRLGTAVPKPHLSCAIIKKQSFFKWRRKVASVPFEINGDHIVYSESRVEDFNSKSNNNFVEPINEILAGQVGEIIVKGPSVTKYYHGLDKATKRAKIYTEDGLWHRMGDIGWKDAEGNLWLCGRVAEGVETKEGKVFYPACCEGIFNQHPDVYRTALIGLGEGKYREPAIVIEFKKRKRIHKRKALEELKKMAKEHLTTQGIEIFLVQKDLPVDVRHNAKIHRLKLRKLYTQKLRVR